MLDPLTSFRVSRYQHQHGKANLGDRGVADKPSGSFNPLMLSAHRLRKPGLVKPMTKQRQGRSPSFPPPPQCCHRRSVIHNQSSD
jgi:hypothetical protein